MCGFIAISYSICAVNTITTHTHIHTLTHTHHNFITIFSLETHFSTIWRSYNTEKVTQIHCKKTIHFEQVVHILMGPEFWSSVYAYKLQRLGELWSNYIPSDNIVLTFPGKAFFLLEHKLINFNAHFSFE